MARIPNIDVDDIVDNTGTFDERVHKYRIALVTRITSEQQSNVPDGRQPVK